MICPNCGHVARDTDRFCIKCATKLVQDAPVVDTAALEAEAERAAEEIAADAESASEAAYQVVEEAAHEAPIVNPAAFEAEAERAAETGFVEPVVEEPIFNEPIPAAPVYEAPVYAKPAPVAEPTEEKPAEPIKEEPAAKASACLSRQDKPLTTWGFIWRILLVCLPIINIIPLFAFAFSSGVNKNSKSFARAILILMLICFVIVVCGAIYLLIAFDRQQLADYITNIFNAFGQA